jgi:CRP-like cAMP-binding protein
MAGMGRSQLALLIDCAGADDFDAGEVILREAEVANRFYLIESGKVVLESGEEFGERWWWERLARAICSGSPGCSRPTSGTLQLVQSNRPKPFSFMALFCGNTAKRITR